jgi:hypothetical protein
MVRRMAIATRNLRGVHMEASLSNPGKLAASITKDGSPVHEPSRSRS